MAPSIVSEVELPGRQAPESSMTPAANQATSKLFSLRGKTVLITGGGRGIGITLALAIVESGGNVACLDILESPSADEWTQLIKYAEANKLSATYHKCDVTNEAAIDKVTEEVVKTAESQGAQFWGAVACAGITQQVDALNTSASDFDRIMHVNVTGVFNTCKYAAKALRSRNQRGSIVIIASMSGNIANRGLHCTAYNSSKAAVQQMCRSLAQEWGKFGIRINSLSPGVSVLFKSNQV